MKKCKRFTAVFLAVIMLLSVMPIAGIDFFKASALDAAGQLTDTISYTFDEATGNLTISGTGDMPDYTWNGSPFYKNKSILNIVIGYGIGTVGKYTFYGCEKVTSATMSQSVVTIGDSAFDSCKGLANITIPESVSVIGNHAFYFCESLENIVIPQNVTYIGSMAFYSCNKLETIEVDSRNTTYDSRNNCNAIIETDTDTLILGCQNTVFPNDIKCIGDYALSACIGLESIVIPDSVTQIADCAFSNCGNLANVTIGSGVSKIGDSAFSYCNSLKRITIPSNVTNIAYCAFYECSALTDVIIENGVKNISKGAFSNCYYLESITIPQSVEYIEGNLFANNGKLKTIIVDENNPVYDSRDNCNAIIETEVNTLISGCNNTIIPDTVTKIGETAFSGCLELYRIVIPDSVTVIDNNAFFGCETLTSVKLSKNINRIYECTFSCCYSLKNIIIPEGVTMIGEWAFQSCENLEAVTIPASVTFIDDFAFYYCSNLTEVNYGGEEEQWNAVEIGTNNEDFLNADIHFNHEHSYTEEIITPATCTENGTAVYTCSCGDTYTETIPAAGHSMGSWNFTPAAGSRYCGMLRRECENCDYYEETEINLADDGMVTGISLNSNGETLVPGDSVNLEAIITPETADNKNVFWTSSDDTVASVVNGTVIANNIGSAVIIAETEDGGYKDFCLIKVAGVTVSNSSTVIDNENNLIYGLAPNLTSIDEFVDATDSDTVFEYDSAVLGTGSVINVVKDGEIVDSYEIVIFGDTNGDAWYDGTDSVIVNCIANGLLSEDQVGEAVYMAADCNHDGVIDSADVALLEKAGLILASVDQSKSAEELVEDSAFCEYISLIDQSPVTTEITPESPAADEPVDEGFNNNIIQKIIDFIIYIFKMITAYIPKAF